jgi:hypothetical protein
MSPRMYRSLLLLTFFLVLTQISSAQTPGKGRIDVVQPPVRPTVTWSPVHVTIGGVTGSALTNPNEPFSQVAQDIANGINSVGLSPVVALASGNSIYLTAKTVGTATNYAVSCVLQPPAVGPFALNCPTALSGGTGFTPVTGYIHPKYTIVGVTYAPPGPSSYVQYSDSTTVGSTLTQASSFSSDISLTNSFGGDISAWAIGASGATKITATESNEWTEGTNNSSTLTLSKQVSVSDKTTGTPDAFNPVNHDYDIIWLWLNPILIYTATGDPNGGPNTPISLQWNGYGYDQADQPNVDVYGVQVGYLNGDFGSNPALDTILSRSWSVGLDWPTGDGPGINASDKVNILAADPFTNPTYALPSPLTSTTPDGRFTALSGFSDVPYSQAGLGNGAGLTTQYTLTNMNTSSQSSGSSYSYKQSFGLDEQINVGVNFLVFKTSFTVDLKQSRTITSTSSTQTTNTNTTSLTNALSVTGPGCAATLPPCNPLYAGPGEFVVYQDNLYGTFMFAPAH